MTDAALDKPACAQGEYAAPIAHFSCSCARSLDALWAAFSLCLYRISARNGSILKATYMCTIAIRDRPPRRDRDGLQPHSICVHKYMHLPSSPLRRTRRDWLASRGVSDYCGTLALTRRTTQSLPSLCISQGKQCVSQFCGSFTMHLSTSPFEIDVIATQAIVLF